MFPSAATLHPLTAIWALSMHWILTEIGFVFPLLLLAATAFCFPPKRIGFARKLLLLSRYCCSYYSPMGERHQAARQAKENSEISIFSVNWIRILSNFISFYWVRFLFNLNWINLIENWIRFLFSQLIGSEEELLGLDSRPRYGACSVYLDISEKCKNIRVFWKTKKTRICFAVSITC